MLAIVNENLSQSFAVQQAIREHIEKWLCKMGGN